MFHRSTQPESSGAWPRSHIRRMALALVLGTTLFARVGAAEVDARGLRSEKSEKSDKSEKREKTEKHEKADKPWCAPEVSELSDHVCYFDGGATKSGRRTLVIYLHGSLVPTPGFQWLQQRAMAL